MIIKIYFEDKSVFLCDNVTPAIEEIIQHPQVIFIEKISSMEIKSLIDRIATPVFYAGVLFDEDLEKLKKAFYKYFTIIHAAGGLVKNEADEFLFIFRRGKWDLPKGKNDGGELAEECALREVKEETGLQEVTIQKKICTTYHTYKEAGKHILKETEWFTMQALLKEKLIPQQDEGIEKIEWVNELNIPQKLKTSFLLIVDILTAAGVSVKF